MRLKKVFREHRRTQRFRLSLIFLSRVKRSLSSG